jgi:hypothetical protein
MIFVTELSYLKDKIPELLPTILASKLKETQDYYIVDFNVIYSLGMAMGMINLDMKYKYLQINK